MRRSMYALDFAGNRTIATNAARFLAASLVLLAVAAAHAAAPQPSDLWYGIYLMNQPIGGSHENTVDAMFEGKACRATTSESHTSVQLLGTSVTQEIRSLDYDVKSSGAPLYEEVVMTSGGQTTKVTARFMARTVTAVLDSGGRTETHLLTVPPGAVLMADDPTMAPPTPGGKRVVYFDPASLALEPVTVTPASGQPKMHPKRLIVSMETGTVTVTQNASGTPVQLDLPGGLSMRLEKAALVASYMSGTHQPTIAGQPDSDLPVPDFAVVTSVVPSGQPLVQSPSELTANVTQGHGTPLQFTIHRLPLPSLPGDTGTLASIHARSDLAPELANSAYLALDSDQISRQAREIIAGRNNLYEIAVQIQEWVHRQMVPTPAIGLPRSSVEILNDRRGVCRDYALLYTALARSAGLPTRLCAGLVGFRGRFYYHAWAESYVGGSTGWMPFDPTLFQQPVDASHIPLVKGDPANLYDLVGKIGDIKINIVECE